MTYLRDFNLGETPQKEQSPLATTPQTPNSEGGYVWQVSSMDQLLRFLILGAENGSYYATERELVRENALNVIRCIRETPLTTISAIVRISEEGIAPKNDPAIFALALACADEDVDTRRRAFDAVPRVCRTGTHLMHFVAYMEQFRGWGRAARRAVAQWLDSMEPRQLAFQAIKYQGRDGWTMRDILRLGHPAPGGVERDIVLDWIAHGWPDVGKEPHPVDAVQVIWAFEKAKHVFSADEIVQLIKRYRLPREAIPTHWLTKVEVWEALLPSMPLEAMVRNLPTMTRLGLFGPFSRNTAYVESRVTDQEGLHKARMHPLKLLLALKTYAGGQSLKGSAVWQPVPRIIDALNSAIQLSFKTVEPTNKRLGIFVDISGSMNTSSVAGLQGISARAAAAVMALAFANSEPFTHIGYFSDGSYESRWQTTHGLGSGLQPLNISRSMRLDHVMATMDALPMGGTNCAVPMLEAMEHGWELDAFVIITDNETWSGRIHPFEALRQYRRKTGIPAKLVVVATEANKFSIADPSDGGMMDMVGFGTDAPQVLNWFLSQ